MLKEKKYFKVVSKCLIILFLLVQCMWQLGLDTSVSAAATTIVSVKPNGDAFVSSKNPNTSFPTSALQVAQFSDDTQQTYLKFAISGFKGKISKAVLKVSNQGANTGAAVQVYKVNNTSWTENTLTWNNKPAAALETLLGTMALGAYGTKASYDVSSIVNANGTYCFKIADLTPAYITSGTSQNPAWLSSKEYTDPNMQPYLEVTVDPWRSALYPTNWLPIDSGGTKDSSGRFLHDFSYAGYKRGEASIPTTPPGSTYNVTLAPYNADKTGTNDATAAIQSAINAAGAAGGGIVYLPAGTYKLSVQGTNDHCLWIKYNNVVLRGDGTDKTFIYNTTTAMNGKKVIKVETSLYCSWKMPLPQQDTTRYFAADVLNPTKQITLTSIAGLNVGDWVILDSDATSSWIAEHDEVGIWNSSIIVPAHYRQIQSINTITNTITIDIPTRITFKTRDSARIYKIRDQLHDVGLEKFSIGNVQHPGTTGWGDTDWMVSGTSAYDTAGSYLIRFSYVRDSWIQNVNAYKPTVNTSDYCMLSNGIELNESRTITVKNCIMQNPQYMGEGSNGYGFTLGGSDCLVQDSAGTNCRHNYSFKYAWATGNVMSRFKSTGGRYWPDFHMWFSAANLLDNCTVDQSYLEAVYRPYSDHGHTTTETVFWNTVGNSYYPGAAWIIDSRQYQYGYVIGTSGAVYNVRTTPTYMSGKETAPEDYTEGIGTGDWLEPKSLYQDQLNKRLGL